MGSSAQLLVLADHPKLQQLYAHRLRERGFRVDVASGIEEGIVAAIVLRPRLIIAEWLLKDGHGLELTRRLRGVAAVSSLPILFLLDEGTPPLAVHRFDDGPIDVLPKPFSFEQLIRKVDQLTAAPEANGGHHRSPARAADDAPAAAPSRSPLAQKTHAVINELLESGLLQRRERGGIG